MEEDLRDSQTSTAMKKTSEEDHATVARLGQETASASPAGAVRTYSRKRKFHIGDGEEGAALLRSPSSSATIRRALSAQHLTQTTSSVTSSSPSSVAPSSSSTRSGSSKWDDILSSLEPPATSKRNGEAAADKKEDDKQSKQRKHEEEEDEDAGEVPNKRAKRQTLADLEVDGERQQRTEPSTPNKKQRTVQLKLSFGSSSPASLNRSPSRSSPALVLLRSSSSPAIDGRSPPAAVRDSPGSVKTKASGGTPAKARTRKSKAGNDEGAARQLYLDLGQERFDWVTCPVCEMLYAPGVPADEKTHNAFHQRFLKAQAASAPSSCGPTRHASKVL